MTPDVSDVQDDTRIWREFVADPKEGELPRDRIRPYHDSLTESILEFLTKLRQRASWDELEATPEVYRVGDQMHCLIPLTIDGKKDTYCFTFVIEGSEWYFQHVESIFIRLDQMSSLPASTFPDLPERQKAWIREEIHATEQVRLFNFLSKEKGRDLAFDWLRDGAGYFLAARAWVPFVPAPRAFILYLCWEQANLRGNSVTLQKLDDREAVVRMIPICFELYTRTGHLKQQISSEDYGRIFETVWKDRAENAGWRLKVRYEQGECVLNFKRA